VVVCLQVPCLGHGQCNARTLINVQSELLCCSCVNDMQGLPVLCFIQYAGRVAAVVDAIHRVCCLCVFQYMQGVRLLSCNYSYAGCMQDMPFLCGPGASHERALTLPKWEKRE